MLPSPAGLDTHGVALDDHESAPVCAAPKHTAAAMYRAAGCARPAVPTPQGVDRERAAKELGPVEARRGCEQEPAEESVGFG